MGTVRFFRQYIPISYLILAAFELSVFVISLYIAVSLGLGLGVHDLGLYIKPLTFEAILFATVMFLSLAAVGLYQRRIQEGRAGMVVRLFVGVLIGMVVMAQFPYKLPNLEISYSTWGLSVAIASIAILLARLLMFGALEKTVLRRRILVLGAGEKACHLRSKVQSFGNYAYEVVGFVPLQESNLGVSSNLLLASNSDLLSIVKTQHVDEIVIAVESKQKSFPTESLLRCKLFGISVIDVVSFYERESGKIMIDWVTPSWFIFADGFQRGRWKKLIKRSSDIVFSLVLGLLSLPMMLLVAVAIWVEGGFKGSVMYRQTRTGANGREFELLKFRSMVEDAEKDGPQWTSSNDARVTKIGSFIRKTRLDELPQLLNVFQGHMSFVGPRPERPEFVEKLEEEIPFYQERHAIKPGITGWAQVCYPYGSSTKDAFEKLQYDLYYVKNYSLFLDVMIILQTLEVVLFRKGAR